MTYILAIFAGVVQGLTEFMPVSSTGHLIIFENFFNISQEQFGLAFDASLHLGTLFAIILFFYKDYIYAITMKNQLLLKIIVGTVPAVFIGLIFENTVESIFRQNIIVAVSLITFSIVIFYAEKYGKKSKNIDKISFKDSFIIGLFQSIALIPGISRSGATISAGLLSNIKRQDSAKFAFLLSGPIIAGAGLMKFVNVINTDNFNKGELNFFLIGMISSAIIGYLTIKYFIRYLSVKSLVPFVYYRIIVGIILLIYTLGS